MQRPRTFLECEESKPQRNRATPYLAYIISSDPDRLNSTLTNLETGLPGFFTFRHKLPVPLNDTRIHRTGDIRVSSLLLTHIDIWDDIGSRPADQLVDDDWVFVFEDDVDVVPVHVVKDFFPHLYANWSYTNPLHSVAGIVKQGLELAKDDGILYLGTCGAVYQDNDKPELYTMDGVFRFRRGVYYCAHANVYKKWRARTFWGELASYRFIHGEFGVDAIAAHWQRYSKKYPFSIATNILWPPGTGHRGLFYQNRGKHPSSFFKNV